MMQSVLKRGVVFFFVYYYEVNPFFYEVLVNGVTDREMFYFVFHAL